MNQTTFTSKCNILSEVWMDYRQDEQFKDFIEYNDMGLPLAYFLSQGIVEKTDISVNFVNETFDILLAGLGIEDTGYETLEDLLDK